MIDAFQMKKWTEQARRDDWHMTFVNSDIRQMLGEIGRLRDALFKIQCEQLHRATNTNLTEHNHRKLAMKTRNEIIKVLHGVDEQVTPASMKSKD